MNNLLKVVTVFLGVVITSSQVMAGPGFGPGRGGPAAMDPGERIMRLAQRLELDADQEQQISDLLDTASIESAADRERVQQIMENLHAYDGDFDEDAVRSLTEELGQLTTRLTYNRVNTFSKMCAVLSPEQQTELEALKNRRAQHRGQPGMSFGPRARHGFSSQ